jgi:hypothetical protein
MPETQPKPEFRLEHIGYLIAAAREVYGAEDPNAHNPSDSPEHREYQAIQAATLGDLISLVATGSYVLGPGLTDVIQGAAHTSEVAENMARTLRERFTVALAPHPWEVYG